MNSEITSEEWIRYSTPGSKFDLQLHDALINERRLADLIRTKRIERFPWVGLELKSETWQWEQTGNLCIEETFKGRPSGITATEADYWVHELRRGDDTLVYLWFPVPRLRRLCDDAKRHGRWRDKAGDGKNSTVFLLSLRDDVLK